MIFSIEHNSLYPHQQKWWDLTNYYRLLVGGKGCGKTYIGSLRAIWLSYLNKTLPGKAISPTYPIGNDTIVVTMKEIFLCSGIAYQYNENKKKFWIPGWDGHIWLGSGEIPQSLVGATLAWAWIDEPFLQKKHVLDEMIARVRHPEAKHMEINLTGTPEELNWGYDLAMNNDGRADVGLVFGKTRDNLSLPEETLRAMESIYSEEMKAAYMRGEFVNLYAGRVYKSFERGKHVKANPELKISKPPIIAGIDFNVDYMSAEIAYRGPTWLHFFDEIRLSNANTYDIAEALKEKYSGIRVYPDPTGSARKTSATQSDHEILHQAGFQVYARKQVPVRERVNAVNRMLRGDDKGPWMTIESGTCPHLIKDMERNVWKKGDIDKESDESLSHAGDAGGYLIEYLFPVKDREIRYYKR